MIGDISDGRQSYKVVVNCENQYSVWPAAWDNPSGWQDEGRRGSKAECLCYIKEVWIDMRPQSLKEWMIKREHLG